MKNIKKVVLSTVASGFTISALASNTIIGEIQNPSSENSNGNCPTGFYHNDLNGDGYEQNGECWSGIYLKDGKVGIGTNNPTATLDVKGTTKLEQDNWTIIQNLHYGWTPLGGSQNYSLKYYKDSLGIVHLRGILSPSGAYHTNIANLPPEYRPDRELNIPVAIAGSTSIYVILRTDGDVSLSSMPGNNLSLDGLSFRAASN